MYWLMSINALVRIALGMALLFVVIPRLALPQRRSATTIERFFWNFGVGTILITLVGQILSLANLFSPATLLLAACFLILTARSAVRGESPWRVFRRSFENSMLGLLNVFEGRVNVRRRIRRRYRRTITALRERGGGGADGGRPAGRGVAGPPATHPIVQ